MSIYQRPLAIRTTSVEGCIELPHVVLRTLLCNPRVVGSRLLWWQGRRIPQEFELFGCPLKLGLCLRIDEAEEEKEGLTQDLLSICVSLFRRVGRLFGGIGEDGCYEFDVRARLSSALVCSFAYSLRGIVSTAQERHDWNIPLFSP